MTDLDTSDRQHPQPHAASDERGSATPKGGRALASLALLISLAAIAAAAYASWLWWQTHEELAASDWQAALTAALDDSEQRRAAANAVLRDELDQALDERDREVARLVEENDRQRQALAATAQTADAPPAPGSWRLAEAEYLLRIANHRLLMERDAAGARQLLGLADDLLREANNFAYHEVRALLAEEIAVLGTFQDVDVQGVFLRLEALKGLLDRLPLRLPEYTASHDEEGDADDGVEPASPAEPPSLLDALLQRLGGLVRFRQHQDDAMRPLLPPRQADYLQMNLRLALDRAQLAVLRHDDGVFSASLTNARAWLTQFVDLRQPASADMQRELDDLLQAKWDTALPDISRSLAHLRQLRSTATAVPASTDAS